MEARGEKIVGLGCGGGQKRGGFVGGNRGGRDTTERVNVPPKECGELVGRCMELEESVRGEDTGLEMRVEILESIAEEQGFSVRWESAQGSADDYGKDDGDIDMDELI